ncbi:MAG: YdcF family protein [Cyanobacteria bacterium P01_A01_bin.114]
MKTQAFVLSQKSTRRWKRQLGAAAVSLPLVLMAQWHIRGLFVQPDVALVLGGATEREKFAVQFASEHPEIDVWISSGSNPEYAEWVFETGQIPPERFKLDYRAVDTVTNFTTLVDDLQDEGVDSIYIITSDYHMRRAVVIAEIILSSRGIHFKPVTVPSDQPPEPVARSVRDGIRSVLWLLTGKNGSEFVHHSFRNPSNVNLSGGAFMTQQHKTGSIMDRTVNRKP